MACYNLLLHGRNIIAHFEGQVQKIGIYTWAQVEASDVSSAVELAVQMLENKEEFRNMRLNLDTDPFIIDVDEIQEIEVDECGGLSSFIIFEDEE